MKTANSLITLILLLTAVFSVAITMPTYASTEEQNNPEEEAKEAAEEGRTEVYDDNPDLDGDGTVTEEEDQKFTDAAVALGDRLNNPPSAEEEEQQDLVLCSDGVTQVEDEDDCPEVPATPEPMPACDGSFQDCVTEEGFVCEAGSTAHECEMGVTCPDGITEAQELSDCPPPIDDPLPFPNSDGDENNDGILDDYQEEDYEPLPYCDLVSDEYMASGGTCHDRKDYDEETLLYVCNDGTQKERWQDCEDAT
ncbi:MAG: hypothetical protein GEU26_19120, partial [Nitrososphaeraceae archaeon]|nr:hypothetical protein [Nitrososphaeraceae archaeon]